MVLVVFDVVQVAHPAGVILLLFEEVGFCLSGSDGTEAPGADRVDRSILILATGKLGHCSALSDTSKWDFEFQSMPVRKSGRK